MHTCNFITNNRRAHEPNRDRSLFLSRPDARGANFGTSIFATWPENTAMQFGWTLFCWRASRGFLAEKNIRGNTYTCAHPPAVRWSFLRKPRENNGRYIMHSVACTKRRRYLCLAYLHFSVFLQPTRKRAWNTRL